ncbi:MAG: MerR family transcriptional regulator [Actinomycetota bacterium]
MRYRVDELARLSGVSVDTVRFYQGRGLIEPPERDGRLAWYSDGHLDRLRHIRDLKDKGFNLASIRRVLDGDVDADRALAAAVAGPATASSEGAEVMSLQELATATGVSPALLAAIEREGLLAPRYVDGRPVYSSGDADTVRAGLALLETGLPLSELLALARKHDAAMKAIADEAVEMFIRFVRDPIRADAASGDEAAARLIDAFRSMLPATTKLVAHHFERVLLEAARDRAASEGLTPDSYHAAERHK